MGGRAKRERDGQLVGAGGLGGVAVIPAAELATHPVIDLLSQLLQRMKHLPGA